MTFFSVQFSEFRSLNCCADITTVHLQSFFLKLHLQALRQPPPLLHHIALGVCHLLSASRDLPVLCTLHEWNCEVFALLLCLSSFSTMS